MLYNGCPCPLPEPVTAKDFLLQTGFDLCRVAVMLNNEIVPKEALAEIWLHQEDELEVVSLVGGG
jgi:thiamine biosynthesis protein ThiS